MTRKINDGGPAFPHVEHNGGGMSVRDYAIIAMMAAWRAGEYDLPLHRRFSSCELVNLAIADVDAMLRARDVER